MSRKVKYIKSRNRNDEQYIGALLDDKMIGFLRYKIDNRRAWLYFVGVQREYRHLKEEQVGSTLMKIFENDCKMRGIWGLEGKYWPKGEEEKVVRRFYERNGYSIDHEDYDILVFKGNPQHTELDFDIKNVSYQEFDKYFEEYLAKDEPENE